jgi:TPR repeat protein
VEVVAPQPEVPVVAALALAPLPAPAGKQTTRTPTPADAALQAALMRRGEALLQIGDISAARLSFARAATAGNAAAASAIARTYDPGFLGAIGVRGLTGDLATAISWYRRAAALGDATAPERVRALGGSP